MNSQTIVVVAGLALLAPQGPVEQTVQGTRDPAALVASFDGMGVGLEGPQGKYEGRNPSDNSLAVGPNHIVQTVNSRLAVFTSKVPAASSHRSARHARSVWARNMVNPTARMIQSIAEVSTRAR